MRIIIKDILDQAFRVIGLPFSSDLYRVQTMETIRLYNQAQTFDPLNDGMSPSITSIKDLCDRGNHSRLI
ncbi:unnamed protein product [Periconia digitata]|uniref:Uncharacterized protein n=1 Tax=Periconia digitata TaxID=1303443 RepID=A0A9W4UTH3_9PLEO|nr:unnamed protein product [Periconia digitata]